jgi:hypothetical protein
VLDVPMELMPTPSTSDLDLALVAGGLDGGFEGGEPIGGGGGGVPTAGELRIEGIRREWSGAILEQTDTMILTVDGAMFYDSDANGYFDHLEVDTDTGYFEYDPETDTWTWHQYEDRDPD